jgi:chaperonin cofactor prefoldin
MADDLATDIKETKKRIEKLEQQIANNDFAGTPYDDRTEAKAALARLEERLNTYEIRLTALTQQQQQGGAGRSCCLCFKNS